MIKIILNNYNVCSTSNMKAYLAEPYRLFFPLGFLLGAWGVLLWVLFVLLGIPYPGNIHSYLMIGGFLTAFTSGFLMTAVPRFTGTFHAEVYEVLISIAALVTLFLFGHMSLILASSCVIVSHLNLFIFFLRRFLKRRAPIAETFLFIPLSLFFSILGHVVIILSLTNLIDSSLYSFGRILAFSSFMLGLVLGVGSRLIPMFNGFGPVKSRGKILTVVVPLLFFGSFFIQHFFDVSMGLFIRILTITYVALFNWSIYHRPLNPSRLSYGLWFSCWGVLIGSIGGFLFPAALIHWSHIVYILGFGLMTLMIGSRVILSHGGFDLSKEGEHWQMTFICTCLLFASLIRLTLYAYSQFLNQILLASASIWLFGLLFWWLRVGSKLFKKSEPLRPNPVRQC